MYLSNVEAAEKAAIYKAKDGIAYPGCFALATL